MKIPRSLYDELENNETIDYGCSNPQIREAYVGGVDSSEEWLDTIEAALDISEYFPVSNVETTIDKETNKVTHRYHYDDVTGDAVEFNSFEKLHDIMWETISSQLNEIESLNKVTILKDNVYLNGYYSDKKGISTSLHHKEGNSELKLPAQTKAKLNQAISNYLLTEIKDGVGFMYTCNNLMVEVEIDGSKVLSPSVSWQEFDDLEIVDD